jgi:DNA-binding Xre family transcriptional regulator
LDNIDLKIKKILIEKGVSAKELVAKIGMTENGFAYSIKNKTLKLNTLEKIAEVLGVPISSFFVEDNSNKGKDSDSNSVYQKSKNGNNISSIGDVKINVSDFKHEVEKLEIKIEFLERELKLKDDMIEMLKGKKK